MKGLHQWQTLAIKEEQIMIFDSKHLLSDNNKLLNIYLPLNFLFLNLK